MRCPFLREAQVKFCRASAYRKMIVRLAEQPEDERCSSREYIHCPVAKQHLVEDRPSIDHCPFLHESLVQYCTAAAVTKYIPYTESVLSPCGTDSHKYCELFLALAHPREGSHNERHAKECDGSTVESVDDISFPGNLWYSPNHLWMDIGNDGTCHIGIDAFLARSLGGADRISFETLRGFHHPAVSFSVRGVELKFVFPIPQNITRANMYLRTNPEKMFDHPYTTGWLFETSIDPMRDRAAITDGLISGSAVTAWMKKEIERMSTTAHRIAALPDMRGAVLMADGGMFRSGLAQRLTREELLRLFNEFFSPLAIWKTQS